MADFTNSFAGPGTMYSGRPPVFTPDLNVAGLFGMGGQQAMMLNMLVSPFASKLLGPDFVQAQFNPTANLYDQLRAKQQFANQFSAMTRGSQIDRETYFDMARGIANLSGTQFGFREARAAEAFSGDMAAAAPFIQAMAPDLFDRLHGQRGSARMMAGQLSDAGRYGLDPVTGQRGMSVDSVDRMTSRLFEDLYGPTANIGEMRGLTAGRTGQLFSEMQRRGLMGGGGREQLLSDMSAREGVSVSDLVSRPGFENSMRDADTSRVKERLTSMAGAVSAMQDLFGEMGETNAPLPKLLNAIEALTQGGMSSMSPEKIEQMVRQASNVVRAAGASMESLFQLSGAMTGRTDALGLDRSFATKSAVGGFAFADAYGRTMGGVRGYGLMGKDQLTMLGAQLEANASASPLTNRNAAVLRLADEFKGVAADTDAAALVAALKSGQDTFVGKDGRKRNTAMSNGELRQLLEGSGVKLSDYERLVGQTAANQETLSKNDQLTGLARRAQGRMDAAPILAQQLALAFRNIEADPDTRKALDAAAAETAAEAFRLDRNDLRKVTAHDYSPLVNRTVKSLEARGVAVTPEMRKQIERETRMGYANADQTSRLYQGTAGYKGYDNILVANNEPVLRDAEYARQEAGVEAQAQTAMSKLGRADGVQRLMDGLRTAGPNTTARDLAAQFLGYKSKDEVDEQTAGALGQVRKELQSLDSRSAADDKLEVAKLQELAKGSGPEAEAAKEKLRRLEEVYGMPADSIRQAESRDLQLSARRRAVRSLEQQVPALQEALRKNGRVVSRYGSKDADRVTYLLQNRHKGSLDRAEKFGEELVMDEEAFKSFGEEGLGTMTEMRSTSSRLRELARELTGGDVEKLLKGDVDDSRKAEVQALKTKLEDLTARTGRSLASGKDQSAGWSQEYRDKVKTFREDMRRGGRDSLSELFSMVGKKNQLDTGELDQVAALADKGDSLQSAVVEARRMREEAFAGGGSDDEKMRGYVSKLKDRGGVYKLLADSAEGKSVGVEMMADEVRKMAEKDAQKAAPTTVQFAPGSEMRVTGPIDITTGQADLKLTTKGK